MANSQPSRKQHQSGVHHLPPFRFVPHAHTRIIQPDGSLTVPHIDSRPMPTTNPLPHPSCKQRQLWASHLPQSSRLISQTVPPHIVSCSTPTPTLLSPPISQTAPIAGVPPHSSLCTSAHPVLPNPTLFTCPPYRLMLNALAPTRPFPPICSVSPPVSPPALSMVFRAPYVRSLISSITHVSVHLALDDSLVSSVLTSYNTCDR